MYEVQDYLKEAHAAISELEASTGKSIDSLQFQIALTEAIGGKGHADLLKAELSKNRMIELMKDHIFSNSEILGSIELEQSIIPDGTQRLLAEKLVKNNNEIWEIHKNDVDPFPSNPHAHNKDSGLKLHLGNGGLFLKRDQVGRINSKELKQIRDKAEAKKITLPTLEL
jgi:hypothetical protein